MCVFCIGGCNVICKQSFQIYLHFIETPMAYLAYFGICLFVAFFSLGIGPINWVVTSEIFPSKIRGRGISIATVVNRTVSGLGM